MILSVVLMHIKSVVLSYLYNASANVGAMVGDTLEVGKYIRENEAVLNSALALLESDYVIELDLIAKIVYYLLKGIYLCRRVKIVIRKGAVGKREYIAYRAAKNAELLDRIFGEGYLLILELLAGLNDIDRVVGDTLVVTDDV